MQHAKMRDRGREKENFILTSLNNTTLEIPKYLTLNQKKRIKNKRLILIIIKK